MRGQKNFCVFQTFLNSPQNSEYFEKRHIEWGKKKHALRKGKKNFRRLWRQPFPPKSEIGERRVRQLWGGLEGGGRGGGGLEFEQAAPLVQGAVGAGSPSVMWCGAVWCVAMQCSVVWCGGNQPAFMMQTPAAVHMDECFSVMCTFCNTSLAVRRLSLSLCVCVCLSPPLSLCLSPLHLRVSSPLAPPLSGSLCDLRWCLLSPPCPCDHVHVLSFSLALAIAFSLPLSPPPSLSLQARA